MGVDPIAISRSALDVEWQRMQIIAQNLANQNTSRVPGGGTFRSLRLVSGPAGDFAQLVEPGHRVGDPRGIRVIAVEAQQSSVRRVYDPAHPDAGQDGFVSYPNVNHAEEMALLVRTARVYESNLTAMSLAQKMNMRALELGRR